MKTMTREFTRMEKVLLLVLVVILLSLVYYYFVDQPVRETIASYEADSQMYQLQFDALQAKIIRLQNLQNNLHSLEEEGNLSYMPSYNSSKAELAFLNDILDDAIQYQISFSEVSRRGNQIRRNFTLQYQTEDYDAAQDIMYNLCNGEYRCLVGDIRCSVGANEIVTINGTATFYETMVGGEADAGLPEDGAAVKQ